MALYKYCIIIIIIIIKLTLYVFLFFTHILLILVAVSRMFLWVINEVKYFSRQAYSIDSAHGQLVRDLHFNPNRQYYLASCGDDCLTKFWDIRNVGEPVKILSDHSHWLVLYFLTMCIDIL